MTIRTRPFSPGLQRYSRYNENGPGSAGNTDRSLTHSLDYGKEGLA